MSHPPVAVSGSLAEGGSQEPLWEMWRAQIAAGVAAWAGRCLLCQPCSQLGLVEGGPLSVHPWPEGIHVLAAAAFAAAVVAALSRCVDAAASLLTMHEVFGHEKASFSRNQHHGCN